MGWGSSSVSKDPVTFEVLLGNRDLEIRLRRFVRSYQLSLSEQAGVIERVDLRYPNGLAVSRRSEPNSPQTTLNSGSKA
jgi:cell division protein FtsQ